MVFEIWLKLSLKQIKCWLFLVAPLAMKKKGTKADHPDGF